MKLRAPSYPLITVDPYFSLWSSTDVLTDSVPVHWTSRPVTVSGIACIDGKDYRFIGAAPEDVPAMNQVSADVSAFTTTYIMEQDGVRLRLEFSTFADPRDLYLLSRPVSFLKISKEITDRHKHTVSCSISVSEEICLNLAGDSPVVTEAVEIDGLHAVRMGSADQKILTRSGDDLRIEWGYFYLTGGDTVSAAQANDGMTYVSTTWEQGSDRLISFAYDDIYSIEFFGRKCKSLWNAQGETVEEAIRKAHRDYAKIHKACELLEKVQFCDAVRAGGEKYAELLELSFRQCLGAHKLAVDADGSILWISKECFSNGCAATVDVSYPSVPMFLLYNTELVKGMMRPIIRFARSEEWPFDFAPHDCGRYPLVNGQLYGKSENALLLEKQMPVEECGNMLIMDAAVALADGSADFAKGHMDLLDQWVKYLLENGADPENQLCTDDFAGHLAHNCNLSLKAIMGIASYAILKGMCGEKALQNRYLALARGMAKDWAVRAANGDGSYRLAFDRPGTFSMKYNIVWDKLFGTGLMQPDVIAAELASYRDRMQPYGLPLDNRKDYTKSDWIVWTATLATRREDFEDLVEPLWRAYHYSESRVPMTDWYWTTTGKHKTYHRNGLDIDVSFRNRTVVGGFFIKLLEYRKTVEWKK